MRIYLYILAGITSALIGWSLSQIVLSDLGWLKQFPELVIFPCISTSLAIGMVLNEIFISSPTRTKQNFQVAKLPIAIAAGLGLLSGLISGGISQILFLPQVNTSPVLVRILGWLFIGTAIGFAEGFTWQWRSIESGNKKRYRQRLIVSLIGGIGASLLAALLFELGRSQKIIPASLEDPIGFSLLGMLLGLTFSLTNSPTYVTALRAGAGFEYSNINIRSILKPHITGSLAFVSEGDEPDFIEEGLSIELPSKGKITIGSGLEAHISIPGLNEIAARIELTTRSAKLIPLVSQFKSIAINGDKLTKSNPVLLKHNDLLTFYSLDVEKSHGKEFFRFVYYNRFLDPQA